VSSFKGGTLIAEDVYDLDAHLRRICDPDGYRPDRCPRCGHDVLHVHSYPERHPRGEPGMPPVVRVAQYICAAVECSATWHILPMFLARHLWRAWKTVERVALPGEAPSAARAIPERTQYQAITDAELAATAVDDKPLYRVVSTPDFAGRLITNLRQYLKRRTGSFGHVDRENPYEITGTP
jgi:hypothetical protein